MALALLAALALGACSEGREEPVFVDPDTVTFAYGEPTDATGYPVVTPIVQGVADALSEVDRPGGPLVEHVRAFRLVILPAELAGAGPTPVPFGFVPGRHEPFMSDRLPWETCVTATAEQVRFLGCRAEVEGYTIGVEGTLTRSGTTLTWDVMEVFFDDTHHYVGVLEVTPGRLTGQARADQVVLGYAFTDSVDLALEVDEGGCPVAGILEKKRVDLAFGSNVGTRFAWSGCGAITFATSVGWTTAR